MIKFKELLDFVEKNSNLFQSRGIHRDCFLDYVKISKDKNIDLIRLITPTTDQKRLNTILNNASGFLYYVTVTGITGQNSANIDDLRNSIDAIKSSTKLPIVAGFGIKNRNDVEQISTFTDGVVVGSSIVNIIKDNLNDKNKMINEINDFTKDLKEGIKE